MIEKAEFDKFADEYHELHKTNIAISGEEPEFFAEYKIRDVSILLGDCNSKGFRILDFGTGVGNSVPHFRHYFPEADIACVDVSEKSLAIAYERFAQYAEFHLFDGEALPFEDCSFDLVFAACVFHHIPHERHVALLREWHRVLKPEGTAVVFEHNPWNPLTVRAVNTCPFDENAELISAPRFRASFCQAGFGKAAINYRLFVPGALRWLRPLERWTKWCPLGAQYLLFTRK